jgi:hypothetical protein
VRAFSFLDAAGLPGGGATLDDMAQHAAGRVAFTGGNDGPDTALLTRGGADESRGERIT